MVNIEGYDIPNTTKELTIEQFDKLNEIETNPHLENFEKWLAKFVYLGVPEDVFLNMDLDTFKTHQTNFNNIDKIDEDKTETVDIDGYTYSAPEKVGIKDLSLIEKAWKKDRSNFSAECVAVLFKREDLSNKEHYETAHIKRKVALFKKQPAQLAIPYIIDIMQKLVKATDGATPELESDNA